jgi:hypothetical protein
MEPFRDDNELIAELRGLRPAPRPDFAAALDERAAAGFPPPAGESAIARLVARLRAFEPRRALIPAGATALAAVAAVTVVMALNESGSQSNTPQGNSNTSQSNLLGQINAFSGSAGATRQAQPQAASAASSAGSTSVESGAEYGATPPVESGPYATKAAQREIERSAQIVLGAEAADVAKDAARVFEAVHAHEGIVLRSSVRDGGEGEAGASFELLIPSGKLGDALAAFSAIAEVRSRHEATADITAPTVRSGELLRDSRAKIDGLLAQLAAADTDTERAATEAELRAERRHNAFLRSQLSKLERRANFSRVSLRIESGDAAAAPGAGDGSWGVGDALGDAGHILGIAAAVAIVGLAILAPIALLALLAWLGNRVRIRRVRERALD